MVAVYTPDPDPTLGAFVKRVFIVLLIGVLAFALLQIAGLAVLVFGAILMAIGLRAMTGVVAKVLRVREAVGLTLVVLVAVAALGFAFWFFGSVIGNQLDELVRQVPAGLQLLSDTIAAHPYAGYVLKQMRELQISGATGWAATMLAAMANALARGIGYAFVMLFVAIYMAAQPKLYRGLVLRLVPCGYISVVEELFDRTGDVLRRWLMGQLVVMTAIGILSGVGLWALGIEAAFALGLLGGMLCFIPYVGAILAAIPAVLVAFSQSPFDALLVVALYVVVHLIEGNLISPLVQARATALPAVLSLVSVIAFGILLGPSSVLVAAPLTLFLLVAVDVLYVERMLDCVVVPPAIPPLDADRTASSQ